MQKWEYLTCFLSAEANNQKEYLKKRWPEQTYFAKHAPQSLIPMLDNYGDEGWELISMQPVALGQNEDVKTHTGTGGSGGRDTWVSSYLCVFKRAGGTNV